MSKASQWEILFHQKNNKNVHAVAKLEANYGGGRGEGFAIK